MRPAALPLMRPKQGRWLCGVCRGISLHLQVSVALVRLLFTAAAFIFGAGIVVYVFLWLTMPVGDPVAAAAARLNAVRESPLSRGNAGYGTESEDDADAEAAGERDSSSESLAAALARAPKPALVAMAGLVLLTVSALMAATGIDSLYILPVMLGLGGLAVAWLWFNQEDGQFKAMLGGIALIVLAYMVFVGNAAGYDGASPRVLIAGGLSTMVGVMLAIVPWVNSLVRGLATERALKEREEERADMTAHLHDGVLQTLALIQMHADEPQTVFSLARQQERELRDWLYQDRTPSERSVNAGLKQIAAEVEDEHGKPIEVVTVGDARPSAQTDALLDAARQALVNAATHGGEPISVYCEASGGTVEVFVRDHGNGFDVHTIPEDRLGIRESIVGSDAVAVRWRSCRDRIGAPRCGCICRWPISRRTGPTATTRRTTTQRTATKRMAAMSDAGNPTNEGHTPVADQSIRVAVVDDHEMFRAGVIATLQPYFNIVGQAPDVEGSIVMIADTQPDVVLLDVHVPGGEGGGGAEILTKSLPLSPRSAFLALSVSDSPQDVGAVIRAGARGYVTKTITANDLVSSIRQVHEGYAVFSPKLAGFVLSAFQGAPMGGAPVHDDELDRLSAREQEVMRLIARGYTYKEVASELFISIKTVETHMSSVLRKLQLSNRTELTRWAADRRIV